MTEIIFVCTGNTCRSPMAAAAYNHRFGEGGIRASSAGIYATEGAPMSNNARMALREMGIEDEPPHRARRFTAKLVHEGAAVVCMSASHLEAVKAMCPNAHAVTLRDFGVSDPFGGSFEVYRDTLAEIVSALNTLHERLGRE